MTRESSEKIQALIDFLENKASDKQINLLANKEMLFDLGGTRGWTLTETGKYYIATALRVMLRELR